MMQVYYTPTRMSDYNLVPGSYPEYVQIAVARLLDRNDDTFLTSSYLELVALFLRLRGILTPDSELKSWGSELPTRIVTLDYSSGQTISFRKIPKLGTLIGAKSMESNTVSESSPKSGSKSGSPKEVQIGGVHYKDMAIQPSEFIAKNNIPWYEANAIKYLCRHTKKNGRVDLEKARHYIDLALEHYYGS